MNTTRTLCLLFLLLIQPSRAPAQEPPDAASQVDRLIERWSGRGTPGLAVAVALNGRMVLSRACGMADLEHDAANTPATIFEAGSVSKQFTAAAVVMLAMQGKLSLDDEVRKFVPEVPDYDTPITIRQMMNHTSGLRDWGNVAALSGWPRTTRVHTHFHVLDIVSRQRALNFRPGAEYSYCNTGFNLLAIITERVSGMPFAEYTKKNLFEPLGMAHTQWRDDFRRIVKDRAIAYQPRGLGGFEMDMPFENVHGNGGLLTTVGDLLIWTENLDTGKVGGPVFLEMMHRQGKLNNGRAIAYASGLFVQPYRGVREISHPGSTAGYRAFLARYPDRHIAIALLSNAGNVNPGELGRRIADIFLGVQAEKPAAPAVKTELPEAELKAKAGLYRNIATGEVTRLTFVKGALQVGRAGALIPLSATEFQFGAEQRVKFEPMTGMPRPRMRMQPGSSSEVVYEPLPEYSPPERELEAFEGEYYSSDAEAAFTAKITSGKLVLRRRPGASITLTPLYKNAFDAPTLGLVRFMRDARGRVKQMSVRQDRVYDLRFDRMRPPKK